MSPSPTRLDVLPGGHSMRDFALAYAEAGFPVFPVKQLDKSPHTRHGFKDATTDVHQIERWWTRWPCAGIGIPTGNRTGLLVLDADAREGRDGNAVIEAMLFMEGQRSLGATVVVRTGSGGHHHYFSQPAGQEVRCSADKFGPGLDVRGEGGYVVVPPSPHESGTPYAWVRGSLLDSPPPVAPGWLFSALFTSSPPKARSHTRSHMFSQGREKKNLSALGEPPPSLPWEALVDLGAEGALGAWAGAEVAVQRVLDHWGVDAAPGKAFRCVLPGHEERHASASLFRSNETGVWRYHDWHGRDGPEWWSLAEVHASRCAGQPVRFGEDQPLRTPSESRWWLRLWHDAGLLAVEPQALPLPPGLTEPERKLAEGFALLVSLRRTREIGAVPFTRRFAPGWCGVTEWQARRGIESLIRHGVICKDDEYQTPEGRKLHLYLPGAHVRELPRLGHRTPDAKRADGRAT